MVQIYENPKGLAAAQVANQHNPEFAALNSITASYADGPITAAMAQMELDDKFGGLKGALKQKQLERKWARGDRAAERRDNLNKIYYGQLGGKRSDFINLPEHEKLKAIYDRGLEFDRLNNGESYTYGNNSVPNMSQVGQIVGKNDTNARTNVTDVPTMNASGRLSLENLRNINKMYPYLSNTAEGRDYLARLEQAYNANPDNLVALQPFLDEARSGKLQLVAPIKQSFGGKYKKPTTFDEDVMNQMLNEGSLQYYNYPFIRLGAWLDAHSPDYVTASEEKAAQYGYVPPKVEDLSDSIMGGFRTWLQNKNRVNAAEDFIKNKTGNYVENIAKTSMTPTNQPLDDQVSTQTKLQLANYITNTYNENVDASNIQTARDANGDMLFFVNDHYFKIGRDGKVYEL